MILFANSLVDLHQIRSRRSRHCPWRAVSGAVVDEMTRSSLSEISEK